MKKRISFRMWIAVVWGGIWQFVKNIFSWKNKTPFWRVIWTAITVCILIVTGMLAFSFIEHYTSRDSYDYLAQYDPQISPDYKYRNNGKNEGMSYSYDARTKNMWTVKENDMWGSISAGGKIVMPIENENVWIQREKGITVAKASDHSQSRYDYDGQILDGFMNGISVPFKSSGKTGAMIETATTARSAMAFEESARRSSDAKVKSYCMGRSSGLMSKLFERSRKEDDEELNDICESYSKRDDKSDV